MNLPKGFLLGAATAAHQVEGNNRQSDYWAQEQMPHAVFTEPSLDACDHYNRYEEDILLLARAGLNAYRFSIEWARIEPKKGEFDEKEMEHYRQMILFCKKNSVEPIITLHHFSSPLWLIQQGGWEAEETLDCFVRYVEYIMKNLGEELRYVCTINEANMGLQLAAISKRYQLMAEQAAKSASEGKEAEGKVQLGMNFQKMMENRKFAAMENREVFGTENPQVFVSPRTEYGDKLVFRIHCAARDAIRRTAAHVKVGITLSLHDLQALEGGEEFAQREWEAEFLHYLEFIREDDFLGIQNYTRTRYDKMGQLPSPEGAELTQMEYEFYPEALENVIRKVHEQFPGDILVTENGIATDNDARRVEFIRRALQGVEHCIRDGIPVKGYCHWSLLDNFEWQKGFGMTFGLIAVDQSTQKRYPKESLFSLGSYL